MHLEYVVGFSLCKHYTRLFRHRWPQCVSVGIHFNFMFSFGQPWCLKRATFGEFLCLPNLHFDTIHLVHSGYHLQQLLQPTTKLQMQASKPIRDKVLYNEARCYLDDEAVLCLPQF